MRDINKTPWISNRLQISKIWSRNSGVFKHDEISFNKDKDPHNSDESNHTNKTDYNSPSINSAPNKIFESIAKEDEQSFNESLENSKINVWEKNHQGDTALHLTIRKKLKNWTLKILVELKKREQEKPFATSNPVIADIKNKLGNTPLHESIIADDLETFKKLLYDFDANPKLKNYQLQSPLHLSAITGNVEIGNILFDENNYNSFKEDINGLNVLNLSILNQRIPFVRFLMVKSNNFLFQTDRMGNNPLHIAIKTGNALLAYLVHSKNKDLIIKPNDINESPLHLALKFSFTDFLDLLSKNADFNCVSSNMSILHFCARKGYIESARFLIQNLQCDVNITNGTPNKTPLMTALENKQTDFAMMLINEFDADTLIQDEHGATALYYAARYDECLRCLKILLTPANINSKIDAGYTLAQISIFNNAPSCLEFLIKNDVDLKAKNSNGEDAFEFTKKLTNPSLKIVDLLSKELGSNIKPLPGISLKTSARIKRASIFDRINKNNDASQSL